MTQSKPSKAAAAPAPDDELGTVRQDPETKRVATRMAPSVTAGAYFILDPTNGGSYSDGVREKVTEWPQLSA